MYQAASARLTAGMLLDTAVPLQPEPACCVASFGAGLGPQSPGARVFKSGLWEGILPHAARLGKKARAVWDDLYRYGNSCARPLSTEEAQSGHSAASLM